MIHGDIFTPLADQSHGACCMQSHILHQDIFTAVAENTWIFPVGKGANPLISNCVHITKMSFQPDLILCKLSSL